MQVSLVFCVIQIKRAHLFESASRPKINDRRTLPTRAHHWCMERMEMAVIEAFFGNRTTISTKSTLSTKSSSALLACACLSASIPVFL